LLGTEETTSRKSRYGHWPGGVKKRGGPRRKPFPGNSLGEPGTFTGFKILTQSKSNHGKRKMSFLKKSALIIGAEEYRLVVTEKKQWGGLRPDFLSQLLESGLKSA